MGGAASMGLQLCFRLCLVLLCLAVVAAASSTNAGDVSEQSEDPTPERLYGPDGPPPFFDYDCDVAAQRHAIAQWNEIYDYAIAVTSYDTGNYTFEMAYLPLLDSSKAGAAQLQCPLGVLTLCLLRFYQTFQGAWQDTEYTMHLLNKIQTIFRSFPGYAIAFSRWPIFRILWYFRHYHQENPDGNCEGKVTRMKLGTLAEAWKKFDATAHEGPVDRAIPITSDGSEGLLDWGVLREKVNNWTLAKNAVFSSARHVEDLSGLPEEAIQDSAAYMWQLEVSIGSRFQLILSNKDNQNEAQTDCPFGFHYILIFQVAGACSRLSQFLPPLAGPMDRFLANIPFYEISESSWPFWTVFLALEDLNKGKSIWRADDAKYKRGYSDWNLAREELSPLTPSRFPFLSPSYYEEVSSNVEALTKLSGSAYTREVHRLLRRRESMDKEAVRPIVRNLVDAAIAVAAAADVNSKSKMAMVVLLYGEAWRKVLVRMVRRMGQLRLKYPLLVVAIGEVASRYCQGLAGHQAPKPERAGRMHSPPTVVCWTPDTPSQVHRFTVANALLHLGVDVFYMDMDTFMLQNPVDPILKQADEGSYEAIFSKHADADCVNIGVFYLRSTNQTALWMTQFMVWYHDHSFEIDQRGMHVFLGLPRAHLEIAFPPQNLVKVSVATVDGINEVVIGKIGWMGSWTRLTIFHWCSQAFDVKIVEIKQAYDAADALEEHGDLALTLALQAAPTNMSSDFGSGNEAWIKVQKLKRTLEMYRLGTWREMGTCW